MELIATVVIDSDILIDHLRGAFSKDYGLCDQIRRATVSVMSKLLVLIAHCSILIASLQVHPDPCRHKK